MVNSENLQEVFIADECHKLRTPFKRDREWFREFVTLNQNKSKSFDEDCEESRKKMAEDDTGAYLMIRNIGFIFDGMGDFNCNKPLKLFYLWDKQESDIKKRIEIIDRCLDVYDITGNIIFTEAKEYKVKDSKIKYKRIPIEVKYPNGRKGQLIIERTLLFSFGVNEKKNQETGKLVGYSIPVCLWSKDSAPNTKELSFFETLNNVVSMCQSHLESEYGADLASSLSSPFYYKQIEYTDEKGKKKTKNR